MVPGVLVPDVPVGVPGLPGAGRLREIVRDGLLALVSAPGDAGAVGRALSATTMAPTRVLAVEDIDVDGLLATALDARPGEAWLVRPDGHVAAVVAADDTDALRTAAGRALACRPADDGPGAGEEAA